MNEPRGVRRPGVWALALTLAAFWAFGHVGAAGAQLSAEAARCAECHDDVVTPFGSSVHGRAYTHDGHFANAACSSCHGAVDKHLESGDAADILNPRRLSADAVNETCRTCHSGAQQAFWPGSRHEARGVSCLDCHSIHSAKSERGGQLKAASVAEVCYSCHKDVRAEMWRTSHHPVREGRIDCSDCHNPHGTPADGMIRAASVNDLCYNCHTEKRGPFLWEHAPVRESCLNCHTPHGSNHLKLQKTSVPYICQQCHSNTRHPGTLYDATRLPTLENEATGSNRLFNRACLDCHAAIHGSNHPSSPYLGY